MDLQHQYLHDDGTYNYGRSCFHFPFPLAEHIPSIFPRYALLGFRGRQTIVVKNVGYAFSGLPRSTNRCCYSCWIKLSPKNVHLKRRNPKITHLKNCHFNQQHLKNSHPRPQ